MSTHCCIGFENSDGSVDCIYCHNDGYPDHMENVLNRSYNEPEKVKALIALGDISYLGNNLIPTSDEHSFDYPERDTTIAYVRDRQEDEEDCKAGSCENIEDFSVKARVMYDAEYAYVFMKNGHWMTISLY